MNIPATRVVLAAVCVSASVAAASESQNQAALPGRQVKVSAIAIGFDGDHDKKLKLALEHLDVAGQSGVDIALLPEEFADSARTIADVVNGIPQLHVSDTA